MKKLKESKLILFIASLVLVIFVAGPAHSITIPGTSCPWLANGTVANQGTPEPPDYAPFQSPVQVTVINLVPGMKIYWSASGLVGHPGDIAGPDGATGLNYSLYIGTSQNGISNITVPIDSLLGVFLSDNPGAAPSALNFSTAASRDYLTLSPELQQVFFMGDGLTGNGFAQAIIVPAGATKLYLGTMDGYGWANNCGSFEVSFSTVPEPGTLLLLGMSLFGLCCARRKINS
jgi:hypothetical protein